MNIDNITLFCYTNISIDVGDLKMKILDFIEKQIIDAQFQRLSGEMLELSNSNYELCKRLLAEYNTDDIEIYPITYGEVLVIANNLNMTHPRRDLTSRNNYISFKYDLLVDSNFVANLSKEDAIKIITKVYSAGSPLDKYINNNFEEDVSLNFTNPRYAGTKFAEAFRDILLSVVRDVDIVKSKPTQKQPGEE